MRLTHRTLLAVVGVVAAAALAGMAALWPSGGAPVPPTVDSGQTARNADATIVAAREIAGGRGLEFLPDSARNLRLVVRLDETGEELTFEQVDETGRTFGVGQAVELAIVDTEGQPQQIAITDFRRERPMLLLAGLFVGAVLAFGRLQGLRALLGLAFTFAVIIGFIVPALLRGASPVAVAVVGSAAVMIVTLYLSHGPSRKTTAAVVGTTGALLLTVALAALFVAAASISGYSGEEARLASLQFGGLDLRGLLLASIIIGGLGVLDDVTMAQASVVFELARADPRAGFGRLVAGALNVGRDHIAATVNTLFLAYAGASLPLLILFSSSPDPLGEIVTQEIVAVEVVRTLVGSIGLIAAVPLTTALAASLVLTEPEAAAAEAGGVHAHALIEPTTDGADDDWESRLRSAYRLPENDDPDR